MLKEIRSHFLQKNFLKKLRLDPEFVTNTLKTEIRKIERYMFSKEIIVHLCYENPKTNIMKTEMKET